MRHHEKKRVRKILSDWLQSLTPQDRHRAFLMRNSEIVLKKKEDESRRPRDEDFLI